MDASGNNYGSGGLEGTLATKRVIVAEYYRAGSLPRLSNLLRLCLLHSSTLSALFVSEASPLYTLTPVTSSPHVNATGALVLNALSAVERYSTQVQRNSALWR